METRRLALLLVVFGVIAILVSYKNTGFGEELSEEDLTKVSYGNIQVTAVFFNPKYPDLDKLSIYLRLDTHSGDLYSYDLLNRTFLEVGGKNYVPVEWKEDRNSWGHHRYGVLTFPEDALERIKEVRSFKLVVELDSTRVMEWKI